MSNPRPGFVSLDDYLSLPRNAESYLIKPLIPTSGAALLFGQAKQGKSYLAIQMALALSGQLPDFFGFTVPSPGRVLYLQLDTPREVWATRLSEMIHLHKIKYNSDLIRLADRDSIDYFPFDILQPAHVKYLNTEVERHGACAVIVDTLREAHSGDEDSSTTARNVIANLTAATKPAALVLISHDRKPSPDRDKDLLSDHRGSNYVVGRMDAIMRLTKTRFYYTGRSIEAGDIRLSRNESGLFTAEDDNIDIIRQVMGDSKFSNMKARTQHLAPILHKSEEAIRSIIRRLQKTTPDLITTLDGALIDISTGEELDILTKV